MPPPPRPAPRLVATDLDGTLLDAAGHVTEPTRSVLAELDRRGVPVVFVTGRPIRWMEDLWVDVGGHGLAICSNGGIVYDVAARAIRSSRVIDGPVLLEVADRLRDRLPGTVFAVETTDGFAREPEYLPRQAASDLLHQITVAPLTELATDEHPCVKLLARHDEHVPEDYWRAVDEAVGDLVTVTWSSSSALVEMSAHGVTKASTLERLCAELDVAAADVVAFGDMPNDIPLLAWAGASYAMAGAHAEVTAVAQHVAGHHHEDGVAAVLVELFGLDGLAGWARPTAGEEGSG